MHYTGEVFRHPIEGYTPLLEVTIGCSHNKCSFCTMYRNTPFSISTFENIEADLKELRRENPLLDRIYLINGDPFVLSTEKLIKIGKLIHQYLPNISTISGYASIRNLVDKDTTDLVKLRTLGFNDLHIGLESAYDPALLMMNKGYTAEFAYNQIKKLLAAGLRYDALIMLGIAGKGNGATNISATAKFLNELKPYMVSIMPTSVSVGSELEQLCKCKKYIELTELEMLNEEKAFIKALKMDDNCYFYGSHYFNLVQVDGTFKNKEAIIKKIDDKIASLDYLVLSSVKSRGKI